MTDRIDAIRARVAAYLAARYSYAQALAESPHYTTPARQEAQQELARRDKALCSSAPVDLHVLLTEIDRLRAALARTDAHE